MKGKFHWAVDFKKNNLKPSQEILTYEAFPDLHNEIRLNRLNCRFNNPHKFSFLKHSFSSTYKKTHLIRRSCQTSANLIRKREATREASFCIMSKHNVEWSWEVIENHELSLVCAGWFPESRNLLYSFNSTTSFDAFKKKILATRRRQMEEKSAIKQANGW